MNDDIGQEDEESSVGKTTRTGNVTEVNGNSKGNQGSVAELAQSKSNGVGGLEFSVSAEFFTPMILVSKNCPNSFCFLLCQGHDNDT